MNRTPNLDLTLYEANDIMDGVDFINENNSKIDTYASQTRAIAQSANALAGQANEGVGAADTKIDAINTRLQQDEVDTLPQYKSDTDGRLEALEDDVNSFLIPKNIMKKMDGSFEHNSFYSGGILFFNSFYRNIAANGELNTREMRTLDESFSINTGTLYFFPLCKCSGNPFGFVKSNIVYRNGINILKDGDVRGTYGIYYDGVDTIFGLLGASNTTYLGDVVIPSFEIPVAIAKTDTN